MADGGTLFLDELCEMDLNLQAKLLRLIQSGTFQKVGSEEQQSVDVRYVCATNRNPRLEVKEGRFREDLYYRLNVVPIEMRPLRDRGSDVIAIASQLLEKYTSDIGKSFTGFTKEACDLMHAYRWPGNVRELQDVIENLVIMNSGGEIDTAILPENMRAVQTEPGTYNSWVERRSNNPLPATESQFSKPLRAASFHFESEGDIESLSNIERKAIEEAVRVCDGNVPRAAAYLKVSPSTLYRKMKRWN
jgi:two-component system repressor protein LuxO